MKTNQEPPCPGPTSALPKGGAVSFRTKLLCTAMLAFAPALLGAKGCELALVGSDLEACGGIVGLSCEEGEFCNYPAEAMCGAADATGVCEPVPEECILIYDPVCGCDDKTYGNECEANMAGVSIVKQGSCEDTSDEETCGGLTGAACDDGEFCNYPLDAICGAADATGVCEPLPEACDLVYDPVCGCDDKTYGNACEANMAGVSIAAQGACEDTSNDQACGGLQGLSCDDGEFCNYPLDAICGAADATGICEAIPDVCDDSYDPVCGCDDQTYGNACSAHAAGVSVASEGECDAEPSPDNACGGLLGLSCEKGEFCNYPPDAICGAADATGVCETMPELCTEQYDPVCGCDGETYGNACSAHAAGVSVASEGECDAEPSGGEACGGLQGLSCDDGEFCNYPIDAICGAADATGVCEPKPEFCTEQYEPVCGCDDQTYGNECAAHSAGVSVASLGECDGDVPPSGETCGGLQGLSCADGQFCNYPIDAMCGAADATGVCEDTPEACTKEYVPVCGCDDQTYGNACTAHAAGVSVASEGECGAEPGPDNACGGLLGLSCGEGEFCAYPLEAMCGAADATGVCSPMPDACTQQYDPVCGCDGKTYGNACSASSAGVSIASEGECES